MSKTRNLSDLLDANGDVKTDALDNVPPSNDASALTTGTLPNDRLSAVPNSALANSSITINGSATSLGGSATINTDVVNDASPELGADLSSNGNNINFGDNDKAVFGAGSDLQIYHDGTNSYIDEVGTGNLVIEAGTQVQIKDNAGSLGAVFRGAGASDLYYANNKKLETTSTGVDVRTTTSGAESTLRVSSRFGSGPANLVISSGGTGTAMLRFDYEESNTDRARIGITSSSYDMQFFTNGNNERMRIGTSAVVLNENSLDQDFRVESNNAAHMLFVDGGNDRVGVYTSSPEGRFDTQGTGYFGFQNYSTQATQKALVLRGEGVSGVYAPSRFNFYTQPGTTDNGVAKLHIKSQYGSTESSELFTFGSSGRLGIGVPIPTQKLDVNGTVKATAFQGDGSALTGISSGLSNKFHAWGVNSVGSAAGWRTINFATETVDDDNKFNHTSGTYTVPATGNYVLFAGHFHTNGLHNDYRIRFYSTTNGTLASTSAVDGDRVTTSGIMALTINEVIRVDVYHGNNAHADAGGRGSFFGGYRLI